MKSHNLSFAIADSLSFWSSLVYL